MEMAYFYEVFEEMPRQGPGSTELTLRALEIAGPHLSHADSIGAPRILDLGCGSGAQTLTLAEALPEARITALDNHQPFLDRLQHQAAAKGCGKRVETVNGDIFAVPFEDGAFDLIWSEGSAYLPGLAGALHDWKRLLRPAGLLMISDNLWLRRCDKPEVRAFWREESPEMLDMAATEARIRRHGYEILGHLTMPLAVWRESYYDHLRERLKAMRAKYPDNEVVAEITEALAFEMDIFDLADGDYSYEYWVLRPEPARGGED